MLLQLRNFIAKENQVSSEQLARFFQIDLSALEPMMKKLVAGGWVSEVDSSCFDRCTGCKKRVSYYQWKN